MFSELLPRAPGGKVQAGVGAVQKDRVVAGTRIWVVRGRPREGNRLAIGRTPEFGHVLPQTTRAESSPRKL